MNKLKLIYWKLEQQINVALAKFSSLPSNAQVNRRKTVGAVVSLTSYPPRFPTLYENIKSLLQQSVKPEKIMLWIAEEDYDALPASVIKLEQKYDVFSIESCKDTRSYKKIIPALKRFPEANIIICDDDIIYPSNWLITLFKAWNRSSKQVVAHRVHEVTLTTDKTPKPYSEWIPFSKADKTSVNLFATGMGGVLYPSGCFDDEVCNEQVFMQQCPSADDVWLFWMAKLNGSEIKYSGVKHNFIAMPGTDDSGLARTNVAENGNDKQINNMVAVYGWPE